MNKNVVWVKRGNRFIAKICPEGNGIEIIHISGEEIRANNCDPSKFKIELF